MDYNDFVFSSVYPRKYCYGTSKQARLIPSTPFPLNYSLAILEFYTIFGVTDNVIEQHINTLNNNKNTLIINTKGLCGNRSGHCERH
jgi:hypothetical protein